MLRYLGICHANGLVFHAQKKKIFRPGFCYGHSDPKKYISQKLQ